MNKPAIPIPTLHLFPALNQHLVQMLHELKPDEWHLPTLARQWTVKDIAAHLLDTNIRSISMYRDKHFGEAPPAINGYGDLVAFLNELNAVWVKAFKRMSPSLLTEWLTHTHVAYVEQLRQLDPWEQSLFSVDWAGEKTSYNWFHTAREYTEKFHHQLQIRHAVGREEELLTQELFYPFINTLMRGLPHTYRHHTAAEGTKVGVQLSGPVKGSWYLDYKGGAWHLHEEEIPHHASATIIVPATVAWKLFTKGLSAADAARQVILKGDMQLGSIVLSMVSVMA